jgi:ParB/Sulfiredoxin domain
MLLRHAGCGPLLDLDDVRARLRLVEQVARGVRPIPVESIIGTGGRCCDFDRCFHPLKRELRERTRGVKRRFPAGDFPPIEVVQIGEAYFVLDGHHRVAAARELGVAAIDANIVEVPTAYGLTPAASQADVVHAAGERYFREESGLALARPSARILVAAQESYGDLLAAVKSHGYDLVLAKGETVAPVEVAAHWFDCVYTPLLASARAFGIERLLPLAEGDLVLSLLRSHRASFGVVLDCRALAAAADAAAAQRQGAGRP